MVNKLATAHSGRSNQAYFGLLAVSLACLLAMLGYFLWASYQQAVQAAELSTRNLVLAIESRLTGSLARADAVLNELANESTPSMMQKSPLGTVQKHVGDNMARMLLNFPDVSGAYYFDADGDMLYSSDRRASRSNVADRPYFTRLRDTPGNALVFSDALIARTTGRLSIVIARGVRDKAGAFLGVTTALLDLEAFAKLLSGIDVGAQGASVLRRSDSFTLALRQPPSLASDFKHPLPESNPVRQRIEAGELTGTLAYTSGTDGVERIASFRKLDHYPFYLQVAQARPYYLAAWHKQALIAGVLTALFTLALGFAFVRAARANARALATHRRLVHRRALFGALFEQSNFLAGVLDSTGHLLEVNERALAVIGRRKEEVLGCYFPDTPWWTSAEDKNALEQLLRRAAAGQAGSIEADHPMAAGGAMTVLFHAIPVNAGEESLIAVTGVDITQRKLAEADTLNRQAHLRAILDTALDAVISIDSEGRITDWNPRAQTVFGWSKNEALGMALDATIIPPQHRDAHRHGLARFLATGEQRVMNRRVEISALRKNGEEFPVELSIMQHQSAGIVHFTAFIADISVRKCAETELLRSNSELEQFSYAISHDMRQPLRMISSYLQLLETSLAEQLDDERRGYFNFAIDGAKRLDQMLLGLLDYSRIGRMSQPLAWIDSRVALDEALHFLQPAIDEARGDIHIEGDWPRILACPDEMVRLLQNLMGNALKFRVAGRLPEVTVSSRVVDKRWQVSVADNGIGIPADQAGRLFQVFQRLQPRTAYEGTGIGLALCRKIAVHNGGSIRVASAGEGMGSCFHVEMPLARESAR